MAENLRVTKYNDGSAITQAADGDMWNGKTTPVFCYYRNTTNADSIKQFGALYNWYVVSPANSRKIAPTGWHVPSDAEWDTLQSYLIVKGYNWDGTAAGDKIAKSLAAKTDWSRDTTAGAIGCGLSKNNTVGFSALPGGYRSGNGSFYYGGLGIDWWSSVENGVSSAWNRYLYYGLDGLLRNDLGKSFGCSVRLLKD
jgi:uncharacterized protein (TIGR02145 family)